MATSRKKQGEGQRSSRGGQREQSSEQSRGGQRGQSSGQSSEQAKEAKDLKAREYRDKEGNIHHHTHKWMEDHAGGSTASRGGRSTSSRDESEEEE